MTKARDIASATTPNANAALLATFPHKNLIINGAMTVNQRGNVTGKTASTYGGPDRFYSIISSLGTWSISKDTDAPSGSGFSSSYKLACTTADASPAAADHLGLHYRIEGQDLQQLSKGTSSAKSVTLSFWVKCNKTGNFQVSFYDSDNTRHIASTVTLSSAATWQYVQITFAGDTTGAFNNNNGASAFIEIFFDAGTDWTSGSVPTTWQSVTQANRAAGTNLALGNSTSNYINITGVQLELGSTATPFEHRSYGDELAKCQRYYSHSGFHSGTPYGGGGLAMYALNVSEAGGTVTFPTTMRAGPTIRTKDSAGNIGGIHRAAVGDVTSGVSVQWPSNAESNKVGFSGLTKSNAWATGNMLIGVWDATAEL